MASTATIEDLAQQLTEVSNKFVDSFVESMTQEDELNKFLRGRQRWYVGTQQDSTPAGAQPQTEATPDKLAEAAEPKKKKCFKNWSKAGKNRLTKLNKKMNNY